MVQKARRVEVELRSSEGTRVVEVDVNVWYM